MHIESLFVAIRGREAEHDGLAHAHELARNLGIARGGALHEAQPRMRTRADSKGEFVVMNPPFRFAGLAVEAQRSVGGLGEHTHEVLRSVLGLEDEEAARGRESRCIRRGARLEHQQRAAMAA